MKTDGRKEETMSSLERRLYANNLVRMADLVQEIGMWLTSEHKRAQERALYLQEGRPGSVEAICVKLINVSQEMRLLRVRVVQEEDNTPLIPPSGGTSSTDRLE